MSEPKKNSAKGKGNSPFEWVTSDVYVEGPNGLKRPIFIELAKQYFSGISGTWPFGTKKEDRSIERLEGFQISYPMTSDETMDNPTTEEVKTREALDKVWEITLDSLKKFCKKV